MENKGTINTPEAPASVGPYCHARWAGNLLYLSGQVGLDPVSGALVEGGVTPQADQAMKNISAVLSSAGLTWENLIKTTVYLTDMQDFAEVNSVYAGFFGESTNFPARVCIQVAALPLGALVEIEGIAMK